MGNILRAALVALALAPTAWSFCGFYVSQEPGSLFNKSSKVVLVRDGDRTRLTMANDYHGEPSAFGLVVPVPQEISPDMVTVADGAVIDKLAQYSVPRLAEYFDPDPCPDEARMSRRSAPSREMPSATMMPSPPPSPAERLGVVVEQAYSVEEYDITVIRAKRGEGLEQWLRQEGYRIPEGASGILESYIRQNMHFFLAKIDLSAQRELGVKWPRPLQVSYDSPKFMLPIRLGTVNADGAQDLLVLALTRTGRIETTNYRSARLPTDVEIPAYIAERGNFDTFYTSMFERQVVKDDMRSVYLEYAWPMSVQCDPCSAEQLTGAELQSLGADWATDYHGGVQGGFLTRLHVRYDAAHFPEDLVFQETADQVPWQARYVVNHPFEGDTRCSAGRVYEDKLVSRQAAEVGNLARLTGWAPAEIRRFVPARSR